MRASQTRNQRFCRSLSDGIAHINEAIRHLRAARNRTDRAADRRRLLRNIERLRSIRQDKMRLRRQRCN